MKRSKTLKTFVRAAVVAVVVLGLPYVARAHAAATLAQPAQVSAADAAPFLGEWTLDMQGANGPATFTLTISAEKEKVTAEIASDAMEKQAIPSISLVDKSLVLSYSFNYQGNPVDAVVTLKPNPDGKATAQIDFAGGAYVMTGTGTKKEKDKGKI
jgi:hypothetical protein